MKIFIKIFLICILLNYSCSKERICHNCIRNSEYESYYIDSNGVESTHVISTTNESTVICSYDEDDFNELRKIKESVRHQQLNDSTGRILIVYTKYYTDC